MVREIDVEIGGKRLRFRLTTKDTDTHSFVGDNPKVVEHAIESFKLGFIIGLKLQNQGVL